MASTHPKKGEDPSLCKALAELGLGAKSFDSFGSACWTVYGMAIQINPIMNSIKQGAMITNINFHTRANPPAAPKAENLPGASAIGAPINNLGV